MSTGIRNAIETARRVVDNDPNLAVFVVRDYEELDRAELKDLAWAMYRNYATPKEVREFLNDIETWLNEHPKAAQ